MNKVSSFFLRRNKANNSDIILLMALPFVSAVISLGLQANFFSSIFLFFAPLALWLSYRVEKTKNLISKATFFSCVLSIPIGIITDYIVSPDKAWVVPDSIFPFRILGVVPLEDLIMGFLLTYAIILFYEYFFDRSRKEITEKKIKYLVWILGLALAILFSFLILGLKIIEVKYTYLWLGIFMVLLPTVVFLSNFPKLLPKFLKTAGYFFVVLFLFELVGLTLNHWTFPGENFIGWIELFKLRFPLEELIFWCLSLTLSVLSFYEFFDDDRK